jgi:hypothetical protein
MPLSGLQLPAMAVDVLALVKFVVGISGTVLLVVLYVALGMSFIAK